MKTRSPRRKILIALAVLIAGLMVLRWHRDPKEVALSGGVSGAKVTPVTRVHALPADLMAAKPTWSEGAGGAGKRDGLKANVPDAVSKALAITAWKDEVKERDGAFGYRGQGYLFTADRERVTAALERVGMAHRAKHLPSQLSGGQQQRVAVARAVCGEPSILLADEPTGNLDSKNGEAVMELLGELHQTGATICMVTHDARYAAHAKRTIHLFDGRVVEESVAALQ